MHSNQELDYFGSSETELIRDPNIAIFELVKNAYDADAASAKVSMFDIADRRKGRIVVEDDGTGMDWTTVTGVWLEPGH